MIKIKLNIICFVFLKYCMYLLLNNSTMIIIVYIVILYRIFCIFPTPYSPNYSVFYNYQIILK